jgi:hypothetical protein
MTILMTSLDTFKKNRNASDFTRDLTCPICLGILSKTTLVSEVSTT